MELQGQDVVAYYIVGTHKQCGRVGTRMLINHLTAAADYNGKECEVVGCDPISPTDLYGKRVHVRVIDPDTGKPTGPAVKLRRQNLVPLGNPNPEVHDRETPRPPWSSKTRMSDKQTLKLLKESFQRALSQGCAEWASGEGNETRAQYYHMQFLKKHMDAGNVPPVVRCCDDMIPADQLNDFDKGKRELMPGCWATGEVDFRRFRECCQEGEEGDEDAVQVMVEWVISGYCEQCQIAMFGHKNPP